LPHAETARVQREYVDQQEAHSIVLASLHLQALDAGDGTGIKRQRHSASSDDVGRLFAIQAKLRRENDLLHKELGCCANLRPGALQMAGASKM